MSFEIQSAHINLNLRDVMLKSKFSKSIAVAMLSSFCSSSALASVVATLETNTTGILDTSYELFSNDMIDSAYRMFFHSNRPAFYSAASYASDGESAVVVISADDLTDQERFNNSAKSAIIANAINSGGYVACFVNTGGHWVATGFQTASGQLMNYHLDPVGAAASTTVTNLIDRVKGLMAVGNVDGVVLTTADVIVANCADVTQGTAVAMIDNINANIVAGDVFSTACVQTMAIINAGVQEAARGGTAADVDEAINQANIAHGNSALGTAVAQAAGDQFGEGGYTPAAVIERAVAQARIQALTVYDFAATRVAGAAFISVAQNATDIVNAAADAAAAAGVVRAAAAAAGEQERNALQDGRLGDLAGIQTIDPRITIQTSGSACGVYSIESARVIQGINGAITADTIRNSINADPAIQGGEQNMRLMVALSAARMPQNQEEVDAISATAKTISASSDVGAHITRAAELSIRQTSDALSRRLEGLTVAAAAGEDLDPKYGVWASFSGGNSEYKFTSASNISAIKGTASNVMAGADVKLYDTYTIGGAISFGKNDLKTTYTALSRLESDKSKVSSVIGSIYASMSIAESFVLKGSVSGGQVKVKGNANSLNNRKGTIYNADVSVAYYHDLYEGLVLSPSLGGNATITKLGSGKASNTANTSSKIDVTRYGLNLGFSLSKAFKMESFTVKPEAFIKANFYPSTKSNKMYVSLNDNNMGGVRTPSASNVLSDDKSSYSAGASISLVNLGMADISVGYVRDWQKNYKANTGFAKVRINF